MLGTAVQQTLPQQQPARHVHPLAQETNDHIRQTSLSVRAKAKSHCFSPVSLVWPKAPSSLTYVYIHAHAAHVCFNAWLVYIPACVHTYINFNILNLRVYTHMHGHLCTHKVAQTHNACTPLHTYSRTRVHAYTVVSTKLCDALALVHTYTCTHAWVHA
jgi:hypothetical protein